MIRFVKQKELLDLLEENDENTKCYFEEVKNKNEDYIYVRRIEDASIAADNTNFFIYNRIEITVYSKTVLKRTNLCRYINSVFDTVFSFARANDIYTATCTVNLKVDEWNASP